ncbi:hypothetical protein ENUP19_0240G0068 [Entamoeba nuttalli]|uniref:Uncharacterized protein n=1 Tax=Entamoeba nuttalli TaxID=412467 RepID=A0ABQ0DQB0_9EUKA
MEEEAISMTMEEDNNQYNPIEINDNKIYNNYVMSIENEDKDDKQFNKENQLDEEKRSNENEKRVKELEKVEEDMKEKEEIENTNISKRSNH